MLFELQMDPKMFWTRQKLTIAFFNLFDNLHHRSTIRADDQTALPIILVISFVRKTLKNMLKIKNFSAVYNTDSLVLKTISFGMIITGLEKLPI